MHLVILHGYLLQGTGSNIYVANIAQAWKAQGHAVTVVCQELQAASQPFVDEYIGPNEALPAAPPAPGTLRVVVPFINQLLPVYVFDRYDDFQVKIIPDMTTAEIESHIELTAKTLRAVVAQGAARVLANHALFGPVIAQRALKDLKVPFDVKIHGSAIEYTLVPHPEYIPYAIEGLTTATKIFVGTRHVRQRVLDFFKPYLNLESKIQIVSPGMDPTIFNLNDDFAGCQQVLVEKIRQRIQKNPRGRQKMAVPCATCSDSNALHQQLVTLSESYDQRATDADLSARWPALKPEEPIILYFGKFLGVKGPGEVLSIVPAVLEKIPQARFFFVGFGSYREHLEGFLQALMTGDLRQAEAFARAGDFIEGDSFKPSFRKLTPQEAARITITGILDHAEISHLLPLASVSIVPSKWAEPFGMVAVEAMAAGVLPLLNNHAGLRDVVDEVQAVDPKLAAIMSVDREHFVAQLPEKIVTALQFLFPHGFADNRVQQTLRRKLRQISVDKFSWDGIARRLLG